MVPGISEKSGGVTSTILSDRMGSMKGLTNAGTVTETAEFDAFGKVIARTNPSATQKGFAGGHGYQEDGESGYQLLGHRYYDADTGRFLSRDPIQDGRNWYSYCDNSPLKQVDPDGQIPVLLVIAIVLVLATDVVEAPTCPQDLQDIDLHRQQLSASKVEIVDNLLDLTPQGLSKRIIRHVIPKPSNPNRTGNNGGKGHQPQVANDVAVPNPGSSGVDGFIGPKAKRADGRTLKRRWSKENGPWPKEDDGVTDQIGHHHLPLGDGGSNELDNFGPMRRVDHLEHHADDFRRYGAQGGRRPRIMLE